jgi:hypothetical protein
MLYAWLGALVGQDGILRPIGNRPTAASIRPAGGLATRLATRYRMRIWPNIRQPIPLSCRAPETMSLNCGTGIFVAPAARASLGDRGENHEALKKVAGLPAGWQAKPPAPPHPVFMKFRGRNAHPNRVEKPPPACRPVGKLKHTLPRAASFSWGFAGRRPIQTGRRTVTAPDCASSP